MEHQYLIGVFDSGALLFELCPRQPSYARAALACKLFEAAAGHMLEDGHYIACDLVPRSFPLTAGGAA